jgi:hypothetical protein
MTYIYISIYIILVSNQSNLIFKPGQCSAGPDNVQWTWTMFGRARVQGFLLLPLPQFSLLSPRATVAGDSILLKIFIR